MMWWSLALQPHYWYCKGDDADCLAAVDVAVVVGCAPMK
jgi:hypothetical protein